MYKMLIPPDQEGYADKPGTEVKSTQLEGGAGRYRKDILGASHTVNVGWTVGPEAYEYLTAFFNTGTVKGSLPFLIDLYLDRSTLTEHTAYFIPGSFGLDGQSGQTFTCTAQLEVIPSDTDEEYDSAVLLFYLTEIETTADAEEFFNLLSDLVNEDFDNAMTY